MFLGPWFLGWWAASSRGDAKKIPADLLGEVSLGCDASVGLTHDPPGFGVFDACSPLRDLRLYLCAWSHHQGRWQPWSPRQSHILSVRPGASPHVPTRVLLHSVAFSLCSGLSPGLPPAPPGSCLVQPPGSGNPLHPTQGSSAGGTGDTAGGRDVCFGACSKERQAHFSV